MTTPPGSADTAMLRRAALRIGLQTSAAVAATVVVLTGIAVCVLLTTQHRSDAEQLTAVAVRADDVNDPPSGMWLVMRNAAGEQEMTSGLPAGTTNEDSLRRTATDHLTRSQDVSIAGQEYSVRTQWRTNNSVVQAVLSLHDEHLQRDRVVSALLLSGVLGLVVAAVIGVWMGLRAVAPLAQALALQRRFVADASHELRTPLTLLSTRTQMLRRKLARASDPAAVRSDVDGLVSDANRLTAILEDLLLAVDPRESPAALPIVLGDLVRQEVDAVRPAAEEKRITLHAGQGEEPIVVAGFEAALRRALNALLDNGIRHARSEVRISLIPRGSRVALEVTDDGPGFDPAILPKIFERFASGSRGTTDSAPRRYGLGLALVNEIAHRHGGAVSAHNGANGGVTTLRLVLPRTPAEG